MEIVVVMVTFTYIRSKYLNIFIIEEGTGIQRFTINIS